VFEELLARLARELGLAQIPYMVIGGQAVQVYGEPRLTKDIDITLGLGIDGVDRVLAVCRSARLKPLADDVERFARDTMVIPAQDQSSGIRVDFILSFSDYERQAIDRATKVMVGPTPVRFAALEDLVVHKLVAGRPRDLEDARIVLAKNPKFDRAYIERWLEDFDRALSRNTVATFRGLLLAITTRRKDER
jgi:predicted nucleotidyltransferase